jgi:hypothetical protein
MGLTRSSAPFGPIRHLALLSGLDSAEASGRIAAADVWTQAEQAGQLDPNLAADALVKSVTSEAIKLTRLADGLRHAARQAASALLIARAVFASADHLVSAKSPNLHLHLELTREIGAAIDLPEPPGKHRRAGGREEFDQARSRRSATSQAVTSREPGSRRSPPFQEDVTGPAPRSRRTRNENGARKRRTPATRRTSPRHNIGCRPHHARKLDKRCAHRADGAPGSARWRFRRSGTKCGQGQDRTVDLPLFRRSAIKTLLHP